MKNLTDNPAVRSIFASSGIDVDTVSVEDLFANPVGQTVWQTASDLVSAESDMRQKAAYLQRELTAAMVAVDEGRHLNSMGVLQSTGTHFDFLVAKRQLLIDQLKSNLHAYHAAGTAVQA